MSELTTDEVVEELRAAIAEVTLALMEKGVTPEQAGRALGRLLAEAGRVRNLVRAMTPKP